MTIEGGIALAGSFVAMITAVVVPGLIVGRYLGSILTTQATHGTQIEAALKGVVDKGQRIEQLGHDFAEFRGEMRGRMARQDPDLSGRVRG